MSLNLKGIPKNRRELLFLIKDIIAISLLIYSAYICVNCKAYQITDQYGNPIPKEVLERWIRSYNQKTDTGFLRELMNFSYIRPNESSNNTD